MDNRYAARLIQNHKTVRRLHSDDLTRVTAQLITDLEKRYPAAIGLVRDNQQQQIISRIRRVAIVD